MKKIISLCFIVCTMLFLVLPPVSAESVRVNSNTDYSNWVIQNKSELEKGFDEVGVDKKTQEKLIEKLNRGELLDSMKPENMKKITKNIDTISLVNNGPKTYVFEDGSRAVVGSELVQPNKLQPNKLQPQASVGYHTIKSYINFVVVNSSFKTDFRTVKGSYNDYIIKSYSPSVSVIGGSYKNKKLTITRKNETKNYRAHSELNFDYKYFDGKISSSGTLHFYVGRGTYETKWFD